MNDLASVTNLRNESGHAGQLIASLVFAVRSKVSSDWQRVPLDRTTYAQLSETQRDVIHSFGHSESYDGPDILDWLIKSFREFNRSVELLAEVKPVPEFVILSAADLVAVEETSMAVKSVTNAQFQHQMLLVGFTLDSKLTGRIERMLSVLSVSPVRTSEFCEFLCVAGDWLTVARRVVHWCGLQVDPEYSGATETPETPASRKEEFIRAMGVVLDDAKCTITRTLKTVSHLRPVSLTPAQWELLNELLAAGKNGTTRLQLSETFSISEAAVSQRKTSLKGKISALKLTIPGDEFRLADY